jgi:hypothetical protein
VSCTWNLANYLRTPRYEQNVLRLAIQHTTSLRGTNLSQISAVTWLRPLYPLAENRVTVRSPEYGRTFLVSTQQLSAELGIPWRRKVASSLQAVDQSNLLYESIRLLLLDLSSAKRELECNSVASNSIQKLSN